MLGVAIGDFGTTADAHDAELVVLEVASGVVPDGHDAWLVVLGVASVDFGTTADA